MSIFRKTGSKWVNCVQCGEEFKSLTAKVCYDCQMKKMREKISARKELSKKSK